MSKSEFESGVLKRLRRLAQQVAAEYPDDDWCANRILAFANQMESDGIGDEEDE